MEVPVASAEELPSIDIGLLYNKDANKHELDAIADAIRRACINTGKPSRANPCRTNRVLHSARFTFSITCCSHTVVT
jgi:hypothetical protein